MPTTSTDHRWHGTSEEAIREVHRLLAEVEANPSDEVQPFNPENHSAEVVAMVEQMERMQQTMVWSDVQGCFVERTEVVTHD